MLLVMMSNNESEENGRGLATTEQWMRIFHLFSFGRFGIGIIAAEVEFIETASTEIWPRRNGR